jgi:glutathione S-transferase
MTIQLYELCGTDPALVFSPFCWRSRLALAHKGLAFESLPWRFTETARLAFANHDKVPVLVDGGRAVPDSWAIAKHLDAAYPDRPALLAGSTAHYALIAAWNDQVLHAGVVRQVVSDIPALLDEADRAYFVANREKRFGMPLAQVTADRDARLPAFRDSLRPLRAALAEAPYLGGAAPDYADHIVMGSFMWARCCSPVALLEPGDVVHAWRERMLDQYGGMARSAPHVGP